ncbi:MAG TPA: MBL fold metallo-hydrolase [Lachnospiraceae bacterium]|nr:MBL fold metallo-hydrolase [Lachnospiraceae bacterium]
MKVTVLIDNVAEGNMISEWGLSIYIEYGEQRILLDTGASGKFMKNAEKMGIDISQVDIGILSHAHFDHANGMQRFFSTNSKAKFYLREGSKENCYSRKIFIPAYIGIKKGTLEKYKDRIQFAEGDYEVSEGISLIPHKTGGLEKIGVKNSMYIRQSRKWVPDNFAHEQSLIFETEKGLVIFNSCSHAGADTIIQEAASTYPGKKLYALIGGFHLFGLPEESVRALACRIKETGIEKVYTGHCTGEKAFLILKDELGDIVYQLKTGLTITL